VFKGFKVFVFHNMFVFIIQLRYGHFYDDDARTPY
jgi:hypothetical protein